MPIASSTGDTFFFLDEHAEPVEAYTPSASSACRSVSPRTFGKLMFRMCGAPLSGSGPFTSASGTASRKRRTM